jgi:hypothetical protein
MWLGEWLQAGHAWLGHTSSQCAAASAACLPACRVVKDTSSWSNKKELLEAEQASCAQLAAALAEVDEEGMRAKMQRASQERDEAQAACTRWVRQAPPGCCVVAAQMMGRAAWTAGHQ